MKINKLCFLPWDGTENQIHNYIYFHCFQLNLQYTLSRFLSPHLIIMLLSSTIFKWFASKLQKQNCFLTLSWANAKYISGLI